MSDIYTCDGCGDLFCEGCSPSLECDFCSNTICPDCENNLTKSDNRHRVICSECFIGMSPEAQLEFGKRKDAFNPSTSVLKGGNTIKDVTDAMDSIQGELNV